MDHEIVDCNLTEKEGEAQYDIGFKTLKPTGFVSRRCLINKNHHHFARPLPRKSRTVDRDGCYYRRPASVLAATPFIENLPNPHIVLLAPPPGTPGSVAHYPVDYPSYKFHSAPYIPAHIMLIVQEVDACMYCLSRDTVRAWTRPSWGWVAFLADYSSHHSEEEWGSARKRVWERYKFQHYQETGEFPIFWVGIEKGLRGKGWVRFTCACFFPFFLFPTP